MILYEATDGDANREVFKIKRDAVAAARKWADEGSDDVDVIRLELPAPSADLVMSILNGRGYAISQTVVATFPAKQ